VKITGKKMEEIVERVVSLEWKAPVQPSLGNWLDTLRKRYGIEVSELRYYPTHHDEEGNITWYEVTFIARGPRSNIEFFFGSLP